MLREQASAQTIHGFPTAGQHLATPMAEEIELASGIMQEVVGTKVKHDIDYKSTTCHKVILLCIYMIQWTHISVWHGSENSTHACRPGSPIPLCYQSWIRAHVGQWLLNSITPRLQHPNLQHE